MKVVKGLKKIQTNSNNQRKFHNFNIELKIPSIGIILTDYQNKVNSFS